MGTLNKVTPKRKEELHNLIEKKLKCQGENSYMAFIDTSDINDMAGLFCYRIINNQVVMNSNNVEILKQNLEKWIKVKDAKYDSLKKEIIEIINEFKYFFGNELFVMLGVLSKQYNISENFGPIGVYYNESISFKEKLCFIEISSTPKIQFFSKKDEFSYIEFRCVKSDFFIYLSNPETPYMHPIFKLSSKDIDKENSFLEGKTLQQLEEIYEPLSDILESIKNQKLNDDMVTKCNSEIEKLLTKY